MPTPFLFPHHLPLPLQSLQLHPLLMLQLHRAQVSRCQCFDRTAAAAHLRHQLHRLVLAMHLLPLLHWQLRLQLRLHRLLRLQPPPQPLLPRPLLPHPVLPLRQSMMPISRPILLQHRRRLPLYCRSCHLSLRDTAVHLPRLQLRPPIPPLLPRMPVSPLTCRLGMHRVLLIGITKRCLCHCHLLYMHMQVV